MSEWKETDYGKIPLHWKFVKGAEYCYKVTDGTHDSPKQVDSGRFLVTSKHIKGRDIDFDNAYKISEEDYKKIIARSHVDQWDVIISMIGEYCGFTYIERSRSPEYAVKNVGIFKTGNEDKAKWLHYYFISKIGKAVLEAQKTGTSQPYITLGSLREIDILVPDDERNISPIAEVLSSLDDKIDLLQRQNKTLEEMAETLFRQWFEKVENEESTTFKNIEEVATVQNGYSFKSSVFITEQPDTIEVLKMGHISAEGGLRPSPKKDFVKRDEKYNKWILNKRDIILAMTDMKDNVVILGVPALIDQNDKYVLNQRVGRIFINQNSYIENILILYMQMKDKNFISELQSKANSGVQVNLGTYTIRQTKVVVPSKENQRVILPQLESIFDKLDHNRNQIQQLETLRDTLLPKLMSGQIICSN